MSLTLTIEKGKWTLRDLSKVGIPILKTFPSDKLALKWINIKYPRSYYFTLIENRKRYYDIRI